jgi:hypothetical protein
MAAVMHKDPYREFTDDRQLIMYARGEPEFDYETDQWIGGKMF